MQGMAIFLAHYSAQQFFTCLNYIITSHHIKISMIAVPWLRRLVTSLSPHKSVFMRNSVFEICGIQSGTETGFLLIHPVSPVSIIPPWLHTHVHHLGDKQYAHWWPQFRKSHPIKININKTGMIQI
jgi:hypothetical protein